MRIGYGEAFECFFLDFSGCAKKGMNNTLHYNPKAWDGDEVGQVAWGDAGHREDGRGYGVMAEDVPSDFTDVTDADRLFHLQDFQ